MPGYRAVPVHERVGLVCPHCKLLLRSAVQTDDGVRLCQSCFKEIADLPQYYCDDCSIAVHPDKFYPDRAVQRDVMDVLVKCENHGTGCPWTGQLRNWENHIDVCVYRAVTCSNKGCETVLPYNQLESHKQNCPFKGVMCKHCDTELTISQLESHLSECPKFPITCEQCQEQLEREKLKGHLLNQCRIEECLVCDQKLGAIILSLFPHYLKKWIVESFKVDRETKQEVSLLPTSFDNATSSSNDSSSALEISNERNAQNPIHLADQKNVFSHFQTLALRQRVTNHDIDVMRAALKQAERDIAEGKDTISEFQLGQKKLLNSFEEQSRRLTSLQEQFHAQGNGSRGKVVDKNLLSRLEALEKSSEEKTRIIRQQSQQISDLLHTVDSLRPMSSKFKDNYTLSYTSSTEGGWLEGRVAQMEKSLEELTRQTTALKCHTRELEMQLQASLASTHTGSFLWRVPDVSRRKRDAIEGRITSIYSPPFYTGRNGYKMCIRAYLNGDGSGYTTHLSLFFVLMKGEYDALLRWPFDYKVSMILIDQNHRKHIVQTFKPTPESSSFQRPQSDMNVASGCPQFTKLSTLDDENYVKDDVMYIKCIVDTSRIFHP